MRIFLPRLSAAAFALSVGVCAVWLWSNALQPPLAKDDRFIAVPAISPVLIESSRQQTALTVDPNQGKLDLFIDGIGINTKYSQVRKKLGLPRRITTEKSKAADTCTGEDETNTTLFYSGLKIQLMRTVTERSAKVSAMEVGNSKWNALGIRVGATTKEVRDRFGKPLSETADQEKATFYYVMKKDYGWINFHFRNNKLIEISMRETIC